MISDGGIIHMKIRKKLIKLLKSHSFIYSVVCLFLLLITASLNRYEDMEILKYIDMDMLVSVVAAFLLTSVATLITQAFQAVFEDSTKLTRDFDGLVNTYNANVTMLTYRNDPKATSHTGRAMSRCSGTIDDILGDLYTIPVTDVIQIKGRDFVIHDDPTKKFTPPQFSQKHYTELINAHKSSITFNRLSLRADDIYEQDGSVHCHFSRTSYFDSLVTNRALDYKISGISVRDLYAPGPFLDPLKKSPLSNDIGFSGMVETSDHVFIFIKRHKHVSVGKNTMQSSVSASIKAKYALDTDGYITKDGITQAIIYEIEDELGLYDLEDYEQKKDKIFEGFSFEKNVLYFYRDLMVGGKPQLMFYARINLSADEVTQVYTTGQKPHSRIVARDELICSTDGYKMRQVHRDALRSIYMTPDSLTFNGWWYRATPSAVATVVLLLKAIEDGLV